MKEGFVETCRINTEGGKPPYCIYNDELKGYLSVGHINGRYGVLTQDKEEFLAFEYDNIIAFENDILQIVRNGKMGIVHIRKEYENGTYDILHLIDCEYDRIDSERTGAMLLWKQGMPDDYFDGCSVRAYFKQTQTLTDEYAWGMILTVECSRLLLVMRRNEEEDIFDVQTGEIISNEKNVFFAKQYSTVNEVVINRNYGHDGYHGYSGYQSLLRLAEGERKEYFFHGTDVYAVSGSIGYGFPERMGFIIGTDEGFIILDDMLHPMSYKTFHSVYVRNEIIAYDEDETESVFRINGKRLRFEEKIDFRLTI